jgi:F-type H+-transporting ATPase subunit a
MPIIASEGFLLFPWLTHLFNSKNVHIAHGILVLLILMVFGLLYRAALKTVDDEVIPDGKVSIKNIFQTAVESLLNLVRGVIPHHTEDYFPLLGTLFLFIFLSNLLGVIPGLMPPTANINTNLAMSLTVFIYYNAVGIKRVGFKTYMQHFLGPALWLAPLMFVIEIVGHCVRPISLSLRLFGNINGDHMVLSTFAGMTPLVVPVIFLLFGIFVAFIQAFVFTLLSTIYVGLAVEHH